MLRKRHRTTSKIVWRIQRSVVHAETPKLLRSGFEISGTSDLLRELSTVRLDVKRGFAGLHP